MACRVLTRGPGSEGRVPGVPILKGVSLKLGTRGTRPSLSPRRPPILRDSGVERINGGWGERAGDLTQPAGVLLQSHEGRGAFGYPNEDVATAAEVLRPEPALAQVENHIIDGILSNQPIPIRTALVEEPCIDLKSRFRVSGFVTAVHRAFDIWVESPGRVTAPMERRREISLRLR